MLSKKNKKKFVKRWKKKLKHYYICQRQQNETAVQINKKELTSYMNENITEVRKEKK